jgi:hypothetical protein
VVSLRNACWYLIKVLEEQRLRRIINFLHDRVAPNTNPGLAKEITDEVKEQLYGKEPITWTMRDLEAREEDAREGNVIDVDG